MVSADAAHWVATSAQPTTVTAGTDFYAQYTMQNTGTTTWSNASGYSMMSVNPNNNTTWNRSIIYLPGASSFAPGANALITGTCMSPITPGTYTMQWQMELSGVPFGEKTPLASIVVTLGADDAQFVSQ